MTLLAHGIMFCSSATTTSESEANFILIYLDTSQQIAAHRNSTETFVACLSLSLSLSFFLTLSFFLSHSRHIIFLVIVYYFYVHGKINNAHSKSMEREQNEEKAMFNYLETAQCFTVRAESRPEHFTTLIV
jgi:hypothetical protein